MQIHLNLTSEWFKRHQIDKNEEYREIKPYWCSRLLLCNGKHKTVKWWSYLFNIEGNNTPQIISGGLSVDMIKFKPYTTVIYSNGMKSIDALPRFKRDIDSFDVGFGNNIWGAEEGKKYFIIKHSNIYDSVNCN